MPDYNNLDTLSGRLLIATQDGAEHFFNKTVVIITAHSATTGTVGYIVNRLFSALKPEEVFKHRDISSIKANIQLMCGGPVDLGHGLVLHSDDYQTADTVLLGNHLALTETQQVLDDIANESGPEHFLILIGKATWAPGQLEEEIMNNMWIPITANADLIFQIPLEKRWQEALTTLNIDANRLANNAGKA